jgi:hypothetical protein
MLPVRAGWKFALPFGPYLWLNHKHALESIVVKPKKAIKKQKARGRPFAGGRNPIVGVRLSALETAAIDLLAKRDGVKRSEMVRLLIEAGRKVFAKSEG